MAVARRLSSTIGPLLDPAPSPMNQWSHNSAKQACQFFRSAKSALNHGMSVAFRSAPYTRHKNTRDWIHHWANNLKGIDFSESSMRKFVHKGRFVHKKGTHLDINLCTKSHICTQICAQSPTFVHKFVHKVPHLCTKSRFLCTKTQKWVLWTQILFLFFVCTNEGHPFRHQVSRVSAFLQQFTQVNFNDPPT